MNSIQSVVVCGTTFGQVYLEALNAPGIPFKLAGILANGSPRSRACSEYYDVPLFTDVNALPADIDIACVVIRGAILGGNGTKLSQQLLARGIHVMQEHPVHHDELADCIRQARQSHVHYRLNSFYPFVPTVQQFLGAAKELFRRHRPLYVDAACGFQVAFGLLDILRRAFDKVRPWGISSTRLSESILANRADELPFRSLDGMFAGIPLSLRIQNQIHASDPDNHAHILHRITFGTEAGELTLVTTHGPIVWSSRPNIPREMRDPENTSLFASTPGPEDISTSLLGTAEQLSQRKLFQSLWPEAVRRALTEFHRAILDQENPIQRGQVDLTLCRVWQDITTQLGPPQLMKMSSPSCRFSAEDLVAVKAAGSKAYAGSS